MAILKIMDGKVNHFNLGMNKKKPISSMLTL